MIQLVTDGNNPGTIVLIRTHIYTQHNQLIAHLPINVWNNSKCTDLKVFGRYAGLNVIRAGQRILTQDDDCLVNFPQLITKYEPGVITCNMPAHRRAEYADGVALVGWGAIFDCSLISVFNIYLKHFPIDDLFLTECDRVFTGLNKVKMVDIPFTHLPNAETPDRLHKRTDHWDKLREIRERIYFVKRAEGMV